MMALTLVSSLVATRFMSPPVTCSDVPLSVCLGCHTFFLSPCGGRDLDQRIPPLFVRDDLFCERCPWTHVVHRERTTLLDEGRVLDRAHLPSLTGRSVTAYVNSHDMESSI